VTENGDCRRFLRQSPFFSVTVSEFGDGRRFRRQLSPKSATVWTGYNTAVD